MAGDELVLSRQNFKDALATNFEREDYHGRKLMNKSLGAFTRRVVFPTDMPVTVVCTPYRV